MRYIWMLAVGFLCSCQVYKPQDFCDIYSQAPESFCQREGKEKRKEKWWEAFGNENLSAYVEKGLTGNYGIKQAHAKLLQAQALLLQAKSSLYPSLSTSLGIWHCYTKDFDCDREKYTDKGALCTDLSYEVDLWQRIHSDIQSKRFSVCASYEQMEALTHLTAARIVDIWFTIQEKQGLIHLIESQIALSKTLLDLVEFRYTIGQSSFLDVYQQKLQLEDTQLQQLPVEKELQLARHALAVLVGEAPMNCKIDEIALETVKLPPFPVLGTPKDLIENRPDLRAAYNNLKAADYDTAKSVADLYPSLCVPFSFDFFTCDFSRVFQEHVYKIGAKFFAPLFDGWRRKAVVRQKRAYVLEKLEQFREKFLQAMQEVEDAIVTEKYQISLIEELNQEVVLAEKYLEAAKARYTSGLNDYLTVIAAIQSLQRLQRKILHEQKLLFSNRANLYRALGTQLQIEQRGKE